MKKAPILKNLLSSNVTVIEGYLIGLLIAAVKDHGTKKNPCQCAGCMIALNWQVNMHYWN